MFITHGDSKNGKNKRLYSIYKNMKNRCYNKNGQDYNYYGGKGVIICDEWMNDYMNFKNWALKMVILIISQLTELMQMETMNLVIVGGLI